VALWLDALARRQRLDRGGGSGQNESLGFYRDLLGRAAKWPDVQEGLLVAAAEHPSLALAWLETSRTDLAARQLARFVSDDVFLRRLNEDERRRLLLTWYAEGDRGKLAEFIRGHADWQAVAWPVRLRQWTDAGEFERAAREAADHYHISLALPTPGNEQDGDSSSEHEQADPVAAFNAYWHSGNTVAGRRLLDEATRNGVSQPVPAELWRLKAAESAQRADWVNAWASLRQCIRAIRGDEPL